MSKQRHLYENRQSETVKFDIPSTSKEDGPRLSRSFGSPLLTDVGNSSKYDTFTNQEEIIVVGVCPACRIGVMEIEYSYLCVCCFLCCFPFGLGKNRRCNNCGAYFR